MAVAPWAAREYVDDGRWNDETFAARVAANVRAFPDRVAVVDREGTRRRTYGELGRDAAVVAGVLREQGVRAGGVVSVQLPNRYETALVSVAAHALGAVVNPVLPAYRRRELDYIVRVARPTVIVTPGVYRGFDHRELIGAVLAGSGVPTRHVVVDDEAPGGDVDLLAVLRSAGSGADRPIVDAGPGNAADVSEIIFTSGTEANPKGVMHTDRTAGFSMRVAYADLGLTGDDVVWMPSPVGHSTGYNYGLRFALYHALPLVLQDVWSAATAADLVRAESCSYTLAATTFLQDLVAECARRGIRLDSLRRFCCGGAPVPRDLVADAHRHGVQVLRLYGSTEGLVITVNRPAAPGTPPGPAQLDTDGRAMSTVEVEVRDELERPVPPGEPGEVYVRGPNVCVGFYDDPERTAASFTGDGWLRSGDLGRLDADGQLSIVGRKKEIIIRGGLNITPREIEDLLLGFPEVERAAVVGLPDERLGERCCACLVLRAGTALTFDAMVDRLRATGLATYKLPERLVILDQLPMTSSGKIQKFAIVNALTAAATDAEAR